MIDENKFFTLDISKGFLYNTVFISFAFDSGAKGTVWHRALIDIAETYETSYKVSLYAADTRETLFTDGRLYYINELIFDNDIPSYQKLQLLSQEKFWGKEYINPPDILLHDYKGRYLWVKIEAFGIKEIFPKINKFFIYYPAHSFIRFLPENYQTGDNSFLIRFTAIFQSMYLDLDERIDKFTSLIDPEITDYKHLRKLALWLKLNGFLELGEDKLRRLICEANSLYKIWGTKSCISKLLELICDERPYIIEQFHVMPYINADNKALLEEHYGKSPFTFTVIFPIGTFMKDSNNIRMLTNIMNEIKPAHTECKLIALKQELVLDSYTYLGLNSRLAGYEPMTLSDGMPLTTHVLM